ncbi:putative wd repeat protein [Diplodia seriata]|uniref:Putative wd repeat protein n=1 Tax=Diplodia seriata TaxID=420778 RepID=A0A0G2EMZ8_9PEZI|nr:putative wd repeat protein [Diplodia seriata]
MAAGATPTSGGAPQTQKVSEIVAGFRPTRCFRAESKETSVTSLDFDDSGELAIVARDDDTLQIYNCKEGKHAKELKSQKYGVHLARFTHHAQSIIYASTKVDDGIRYLSTHDNSYIRYFKGHTDTVTCLALNPSNDTFVSCSQDNTVRLWSLNSPNTQGMLKLHAPWLAAYDPSASVIAIASPPTQTILLYDVRNFDKPPFATFDLHEMEQQYTPGAQQRSITSGLRYPSNRKTIYDRNLGRSKNAELSRAAFAYLFVEMITYAQRKVTGVADLEKRLNSQGYPLGLKLLDLLSARSPVAGALTANLNPTRPTRVLALLQFITTTLWKHLFNRPADALERSAQAATDYMITDNAPLVVEYVSTPREMSSLNVAAFVAGVVEGVCDGAGFPTKGVTAHWVDDGAGNAGQAAGPPDGEVGGTREMWPSKTIFLIKFDERVIEREEILEPPK